MTAPIPFSRLRSVVSLALVAALAGAAPFAMADDGDSYELSQAVGQAGAAVQGEVLKATLAKKNVAEGLASYRAQTRLQDQAVKLQEDMSQPDHLCADMSAQDAVAAGTLKGRANMRAGQRKTLARVTGNVSTTAAVEASHQDTNTNFCSATEQAQGVCKATTVTKYANLAGADQDAMYLFQSRTGGDTYDGTRDGAQVDAVNAYIARVVGGPAPAQQLQRQTAAAYQKNPQARAYIELQRRYAAFLSMATYSLNQIKESRNPQN